jgi:hypothetical protein
MTLTVRRENLPVRCEICHQTDLFNPETGNCGRCDGVTIPALRRKIRRYEPTKRHDGLDCTEAFAEKRKRAGRFIAIGNSVIGLVMLLIWAVFKPGFLPVFVLFHLFVLITGERKMRCPACNSTAPLGNWSFRPGKNCCYCGAILMK